MKTVLVTGLNGRIAPVLKTRLENEGLKVVPFDRKQLDIDNLEQQRNFIQSHKVDAICHLATGAESWVSILGKITYELKIPFLFTSTESVFNPEINGPYNPFDKPTSTSDYGRYKIACEQAALNANPDTIIARLGWQMFTSFDTDNLLTHVRDMHDKNGYLEASTEWIPATALVNNTMMALSKLISNSKPGIYHLEGNVDGLSFFEIVTRINRKFDLGWDIRPTRSPQRDGRIIDMRIRCGNISEFLS